MDILRGQISIWRAKGLSSNRADIRLEGLSSSSSSSSSSRGRDQSDQHHLLAGAAPHNSAAGNSTRVFRVTGGNTDHYTTADMMQMHLEDSVGKYIKFLSCQGGSVSGASHDSCDTSARALHKQWRFLYAQGTLCMCLSSCLIRGARGASADRDEFLGLDPSNPP